MGAAIHRLLLSSILVIIFIPVRSEVKLWLTAIIYFVSHLAVSFITPAVSNMYVSFVPQSIRGKYFGLRESLLLLFATIVTFIVGKVMDNHTAAGNEAMGYIIVYIVIFILL